MECQGYYIAEPEMLEWSCTKAYLNLTEISLFTKCHLKFLKVITIFMWQANQNTHNCMVLQNNLNINLVILARDKLVKDLAFSLRECGGVSLSGYNLNFK